MSKETKKNIAEKLKKAINELAYYKKGRKTQKVSWDDKNYHKADNLEMCENTYELKSKVMEYVYQAKNLLESHIEDYRTPRVEVKIVDITVSRLLDIDTQNISDVLGLGSMSGYPKIWIAKRAICDRWDLQELTYHELLHAIFNLPHFNGSPLMSPTINSGGTLSPDDLHKVFLSHALAKIENLNWDKVYGNGKWKDLKIGEVRGRGPRRDREERRNRSY